MTRRITLNSIRTLFIMILIFSLAANIYNYRHAKERSLDHYTHKQYSLMLYRIYEEPIGLNIELLQSEIKSAISEKKISRVRLDQLVNLLNDIKKDQVNYSYLVQDYSMSGKGRVDYLIEDKSLLMLDYLYGFVYFGPIIAYWKGLLTTDHLQMDFLMNDIMERKFEVALEITSQHAAVYTKYINQEFDPSLLEKSIETRLRLQKELTTILPGLVQTSLEMSIN